MSAHMMDPEAFRGCTYCGGPGCSECEPPDPWCSWCDADAPEACVCDEAPEPVHPDEVIR